MNRNGFTLVEMLIALVIFGMLAAAGVALLSVSLRTQETADAMLERIGGVRRADALLSADLAQAAARTWRDSEGRRRPAFAGGADEEGALLAFVRGGREDISGTPRSSLQRVEYRLRDRSLERLAFPAVDGGGDPVAVPLIEDVRAVRLRFRDEEGEWRERWDPTDPGEMPRAVELVADTDAYGAVRHLFLVGGGR